MGCSGRMFRTRKSFDYVSINSNTACGYYLSEEVAREVAVFRVLWDWLLFGVLR
jgi:hypothetical protein